MQDIGIGKLIDIENPQRDAIHIAVAPVVAAGPLRAGQHVGFIGDRVGESNSPIGIVDPFLNGSVRVGQRFWLFLYPNTITSLRHNWTHPAFESDPVKAKAEAWLRDFADRVDLSYRTVLDAAREFLETGDSYVQRGSESARDKMYESAEQFWTYYEIVTGVAVPEDKRGTVFSCTC